MGITTTRSDEFIPSISIVIPTYNSEKTIGECLASIANQNYPKDRLQVVIADGGSKDGTLNIAKKFNVDQIVRNERRTGEAGKAMGVKVATNAIIALIDSDNILDDENWLKKMTKPFTDPDIIGSEPLYYTYRTKDSLITRYCALLGMNDVLCLYLGNYDRFSFMTLKWTELPVSASDNGEYLALNLRQGIMPTIGANGFLIRRDVLEKIGVGAYLFDVDIMNDCLAKGYTKFAKVKIGIVHLFASSTLVFMKKTFRRIRDYTYYGKFRARSYPWGTLVRMNLARFVLETVLIVPLASKIVTSYKRKPDVAWLFHPLAVWLTLLIYSITLVINSLRR